MIAVKLVGVCFNTTVFRNRPYLSWTDGHAYITHENAEEEKRTVRGGIIDVRYGDWIAVGLIHERAYIYTRDVVPNEDIIVGKIGDQTEVPPHYAINPLCQL